MPMLRSQANFLKRNAEGRIKFNFILTVSVTFKIVSQRYTETQSLALQTSNSSKEKLPFNRKKP